MNYKDIFIDRINEVVGILEEFRDICNTDFEDSQLNKSLSDISYSINNGLKTIKKDLNILTDNVDWETFNVAFFGETNAGKSTLIEAVLKGDGERIGDGSKDFTKNLSPNNMGEINLLDMPGIEGDEKKFTDDIINAIERSHVVFYVNGADKEPEEGTLKKIKGYLKGKAKVYSVLNVRGEASVYKYKKALIDDNIKKVEARTIAKVQNILGKHYENNIILNAKLGYLSVGQPIKNDLVRSKNKVLGVFKSFEDAYLFSNVNKFKELLFSLSQDSKIEIIISNTYKFVSTLERITLNIIREKKNFDKSLKLLREYVESANVNINAISHKYQDEIINLVSININKMKNEIKNVVYLGIENGYSESKIKQGIQEIINNYKSTLKSQVDKLLIEMNEEVESVINELQHRIDMSVKFGGFNEGEINIAEILSQMALSFKYIFKEAIDIGVTIFGIITTFAINPILGAVAIVVSVIKKIWDWFFSDPKKREREAKAKAYTEIEKSICRIEKEITMNMKQQIKKLEKEANLKFSMMHSFFKAVNKVSFEMAKKISDIGIVKVRLSSLVASEILKSNPEIAYIDLKLSQMLIIGENLYQDNKNIFRVNQVHHYDTFGEWLYNIEHRIENNYIVLYENNEFVYRALSACIEYYNRKGKFNIRGVRRTKIG